MLLFPVAQISELPDFTAQTYHPGNLFRMQMLGPSTGDAESGNLTSVMKPAYFFKYLWSHIGLVYWIVQIWNIFIIAGSSISVALEQ